MKGRKADEHEVSDHECASCDEPAVLRRAAGPGNAIGPRCRDELAGGKLSVKGSITAGMAYRTVSRDTDLLADVNSSQVGIVGTSLTPTTGRNQDDGNLNFDKGDPVSQVVNGYLSLEYKSGNYGATVSAKAWYDYAYAKSDRPWGNIPNGYTPGAPLSDRGAQVRSRADGVALDNLYANGSHNVGAKPLEWKLGYQKLDWGNRFIVLGGLRDLNPIDIPALTRPGMLQREQETRIPVPQIFARLGSPQVHLGRGLLPVQLRAQRAEPLRHLLFGGGLVFRRLQRRDGRQHVRPHGARDGELPQARGQCDALRQRAVRRGAFAHGGKLGDEVRPLCHAVPFAHGLQRRDQVDRHGRGRPSCRATRPAGIRSTTPSTPRTSGCSA